jgi:hypothetical protein
MGQIVRSTVARQCMFTCTRGGVAVHVDAAISQEQDQAIPIFGDVFECRACWGLGRDLCAGMAQPCFEGFDFGCAFGLAQRQSTLGRCAAGLLFDPVKSCDLFEALFRDRRYVVMGRLCCTNRVMDVLPLTPDGFSLRAQ